MIALTCIDIQNTNDHNSIHGSYNLYKLNRDDYNKPHEYGYYCYADIIENDKYNTCKYGVNRFL